MTAIEKDFYVFIMAQLRVKGGDVYRAAKEAGFREVGYESTFTEPVAVDPGDFYGFASFTDEERKSVYTLPEHESTDFINQGKSDN